MQTEDVGDERGEVKDFEQAAMPENWNPVEYTIFVTLGPPALEKCIPALAWKAKGRECTNDCVDADLEEEHPVQVSREADPSSSTMLPFTMKKRPKSRKEMRMLKLEYDKEQKSKAKHCVAQDLGASNVSPQQQFTPGTKAMLGVMDDVKQQVQAMNYQNTMLSLFHMEDDVSAKASLKEEMLALKNSLRETVLGKQKQRPTATEELVLCTDTNPISVNDSDNVNINDDIVSKGFDLVVECGSESGSDKAATRGNSISKDYVDGTNQESKFKTP